MPRLAPLPDEQIPDAAKPTVEVIEKKFGSLPNIFRTMAHNPDVLEAAAKLFDAIEGDLPDRYRELAYLKASKINNCDYCTQHHTAGAKKAGVTDDQLEAFDAYEQSDAFDDTDKAVLRFSERLTKSTDVDDETVAALKEKLSPSQLVALEATVGLANFTNRFNHAFDVELP